MLYPTSHHSLFSPLTFSSSASAAAPPLPPAPLKAVMECVEFGAMKSFVRPEAASKMIQQQGCLENELEAAGNAQGGAAAVSGDDLFVDELLDFSNGFVEEDEEENERVVDPPLEKREQGAQNLSVTPLSVSPQKPEAVTFPVVDGFASLPGVPADDLDNLEWLSHFVEESFSDEYSLKYPAGKFEPENYNRSVSKIPVQGKPGFTTPVQTKARTKRARTGIRVWPVVAPSLTESSASSSSSSSSTTTLSSSPSNRWFLYCSSAQIGKPPAKKPGLQPGPARRCSHCGVQKTPQWRAGPLGAKTLCNACGVRYKSGRLLPEYRPACSPTFSRELHSNNHRKVLEMRRKKEAETGSSLGSPVQSF